MSIRIPYFSSTLFTLVTLFLVSWSGNAQAIGSEPSTRYVSATYQEFEDQFDFDGAGFDVSGRLGRHWLLAGSYAEVSAQAGDIKTDWDITSARLGYMLYEGDSVALYSGPQALYISYQDEGSMSEDSETNFGAFVTLRYMATLNIELNGELSYIHFDTISGDTLLQYNAGTRFFLFEHLTLDATAKFGEWSGFQVGVSFHF
ncbi:hypothetical protein [Aliidiomarina soli]|uniref:Outer membrane protein beta-barrel domain-containing protein n=1 Tax=Aliidiomarina soli TaxID=1928574 RepID=A0A432WJB4_9GAMM|nr:hypothetical protein [Aliidiomarina soli]RUO33848.1 hypothetical protein CWE14_05140 [Aliidiomarina soli]